MKEDFIGMFPNAATKEYCNLVVEWFEYIKESKGTGRGKIISRQELEGVSSVNKDSNLYFLGSPDQFRGERDEIVLDRNHSILREFNEIIWNCYDKYKEKYGILDSLAAHNRSMSVKIQKYKPSQGYHVWHSDVDCMVNSRRMLVCMLYLNTVEEGGETEFLHQSVRVTPEQGTLVLFPSYWTHPHRGNPPLEGEKYVMNTWLEFME